MSYGEALAIQQQLAVGSQAGAWAAIICCSSSIRTSSRSAATGMKKICSRPKTCCAAPASNSIESDRGGDVTYHGPGQIVGYPIMDLRDWKRDVGAFVRSIEQVLIDTLESLGFVARRIPKLTGVWVGEGDARENRRHRRPPEPLGVHAWLGFERDHGPPLLSVHRAVRPHKAGHVDGGSWACTPTTDEVKTRSCAPLRTNF